MDSSNSILIRKDNISKLIKDIDNLCANCGLPVVVILGVIETVKMKQFMTMPTDIKETT